jgi:hypothetical protein
MDDKFYKMLNKARRITSDEYEEIYNDLNNDDKRLTQFIKYGALLWYFNNKLVKTIEEKNKLPEIGDHKIVVINFNNLDIRILNGKILLDLDIHENLCNYDITK